MKLQETGQGKVGRMRKMDRERHIFLGALVLAAQYWIVPGTAAQTVPTTTGLDFSQVDFIVVSQPEYQERLYSRALRQLKEAGIYKEESDHATKKSATLTLTLKPELIGTGCPGKFLYAPSLMLTEEVIVERNGVSIQDVTWSSKRAAYPVPLRSIDEIEADLDDFISRFIVNYKMGNPAVSSQKELREAVGPKHSAVQKLALAEKDPQRPMGGHPTNASLRGLDMGSVKFMLWAGSSTKPLSARAIERALKEGLKLSFKPNVETPATLTLRLDPRSIEEACPGKVLYESSLELVEQVKIKRNPAIYIWSTTWSKHKTNITDPVPLRKLETDVDELLDQFAASYNSDNKRSNKR
jgi:hypothetical protein